MIISLKVSTIYLCILAGSIHLLFSCNKIPPKVTQSLEKSRNNITELKKVIEHYKHLGDEEKLKAAYFLIGNMQDKYSVIWQNRGNYEELYDFVKAGNKADKIGEKWDSLKSVYKVKTKKLNDLNHITSTFLIRNIDMAFTAWRNLPWGKHYNFEQFCEYILPYRVENEPLDDWRPYLYEKMKWMIDSLKNKNDIREACKYINDYVCSHHRLATSMDEVPVLSTLDAFNHPAGICEHRIIMIINLLRTFGIPCARDFTPQYTNWAGSHSWITLIDTTGQPVSFSGGDSLTYLPTNKMPMGFGQWQATKIYRYTFTQNHELELLFKNSCIDVTDQYDMTIKDIQFKINGRENEKIMLCTFGNKSQIVPVACSEVHSSIVRFNKVGLNTFYFPALITEEGLMPLQNPLFFDSSGKNKAFHPSKEVIPQINLTRKFPDDGSMTKFGQHILGSKIEGSNDPEFKTPVLLHCVNDIPYHFVSIYPTITQKFRYVRYKARDSGCIRLAELEYFSPSGKLTGKISGERPERTIPLQDLKKVVDTNFSTWLDAPGKSWILMDFGKPYEIYKIKYVQRSRMNYIEIGHTYELFYFNIGWKSLGQTVATESFIEFKNVPSNAVMLLRDLTKGKEERIFIYENGQQVWK